MGRHCFYLLFGPFGIKCSLKGRDIMDAKKQFGEYLASKRKASQLTQQELADRLYVTKTAVSKWERGISYPDITLVKSICENLNITAEEFINASDDLETRKSKRESQYYKKTALWYHSLTLGFYGFVILVTFIVNLAVDRKLSWFFPVLTSLLFCASLTNLPFLHRHVPEEYRRRALILQFTLPLAFLFLILLSTGICNPLEWLLNSYLGILFAYSLFVLPVFLKKLDVFEKKTRLLLAFTTPLAMLLLLMLYECVISGGDWFIISALGVLVVYEVIFLPHILDLINPFTKKYNFLLTLGAVAITFTILTLVTHL